jgi:hypothetical protein
MEYVFTRFRVGAWREDDRVFFALELPDRDIASFAIVMTAILHNERIFVQNESGAPQVHVTLH